MSSPSSSGTEKAGAPKKGVSPMRNLIGLVVLVAVSVVAYLEFSAKNGYNAAVNGLADRSKDDTKNLATIGEAEVLIGKSPDGPDSDSQVGVQTFMKRTYTWKGLIKSYTLTAYYTKDRAPGLHHFETEGAPYVPEKVASVSTAAADPAPGAASAPGKRQPDFAPIPGPAKATAKPATDTPKPEAPAPAPADATAKPSAETPKPAAPPAPAPAKNPNP